MKIAKVGNRRIYYTEVQIIKDKFVMGGVAEFATLKEARADIRQKVHERYGKVKYKVIKLFQLPPGMEIEEVEE
jgi:hypothetical protein